MTKSRGILPPRRPWFAWELEFLRTHFPTTQTRIVAQVLDRTEPMVNGKAAQLGLRKTAEYLASPAAGRLDGVRGESCRFVKGQTSWNKGMKLPGHGNPETFFKPGQKPHTWLPVGSLRLSKDGYLQRKVTDTGYPPRDWQAVHRLVWEAAHGPVPDGHVVVFKPGRKSTDVDAITVDAVDLVTRQELMRRNSVHTVYPPEVARVVQLMGAVTRQINKRAKHEQEHQ